MAEEVLSVASWQQLVVVMGDGTMTQSIYPTLNSVNLTMTYEQETHSKQILGEFHCFSIVDSVCESVR